MLATYKSLGLAMLLVMSTTAAQAEQPMVVDIKRISMETALKIAQAAIAACRKERVQVAVTVVDRGGHVQVVLRDVLAMDLTLPISYQKAYTAMSFNTATSALSDRFKGPGVTIAKVDGVLPAAGGVPIAASGTILGGVGVSGAPSGKTDEKCAAAGVNAVQADLEMASM